VVFLGSYCFCLQEFYLVSLDPAPKTSRVEALLLTTDTEVSIAPRLRKSLRKNASKGTEGINGKTLADGSSVSAAVDTVMSKDTSKALALRILPSTILSEPSLRHTTYNAKEPLAFVSLHTQTLLHSLSPTTTAQSSLIAIMASLRSLPAPPDPSGSPSVEPTRPEAGSQPVSISGKHKNNVSDKGLQEGDDTLQIWCCADTSGQIPDGHVVFPLGIRNVADWDIVRYAYITRPFV
jgi:peroxin-1